MTRIGIYVRVSTDDQTVENQTRELEAVAGRHGWSIVATFKDEGISGSKGRDKRPGLDALLKAVSRREIDVVAAWSVDRLGRSVQDLVSTLAEIHAKGCDLYLHQQGIDTRTPAGKAMFQMMGVFAEFERAMIVARVKAGVARARAQGKHIGRRFVEREIEERVRELARSGVGKVKIGKTLGIGTSAVQRVLSA